MHRECPPRGGRRLGEPRLGIGIVEITAPGGLCKRFPERHATVQQAELLIAEGVIDLRIRKLTPEELAA